MVGFFKAVCVVLGIFMLYVIVKDDDTSRSTAGSSSIGGKSRVGQTDFEAEIRRIAPQALGDLRAAPTPLDEAMAAQPGAGSYGGYSGDSGSRRGSSDDLANAKSGFESAADDLRSSVRGLQYNDWSSQMGTIRVRLSDAENALSELEDLNPNDPAVQAARDEIDTMQSHVRRLSRDNWREVAPDLDRGSRNIEDEAYATSDESDSSED